MSAEELLDAYNAPASYHHHNCPECIAFGRYAEIANRIKPHPPPLFFEKLFAWTKHLGFETYNDYVEAEMNRIDEIDRKYRERSKN